MLKTSLRLWACYVFVGLIAIFSLLGYGDGFQQITILGNAGCYLDKGPGGGFGVECANFFGSGAVEAAFIPPLIYLYVLAFAIISLKLSWWGMLFIPIAACMWVHLIYVPLLVIRDLTRKGIGRVTRADA